MKKRICHVTSVHDSHDVRILEKECCSLAKKSEYEVFLVAKGNSYNYKGVKVVGVGQAPNSRFKRVFSFSRIVVEQALKINADIYHLHDPELLQYVGLLKRKGKKVIFDSHEDIADSILDKEYLPIILRKPIARLYSIIQKIQISKCHSVVSVTPHIVEKIRRYCKNVYMITNYPIIQDSKITNRQTEGQKKIIFAGGITDQWSHDIIIEAISQLTEVTYELYGKGDKEYLSYLKTLPGWQKVNYYGTVSHDRVEEALNNATIAIALLKPSNNTAGKKGTIGNTKIFECMSAGLPIICTDFILWKEIVEGNEAGITIPVNDVNQLRAGILRVLSDEKLANKMGENGKRAVQKSYNWSTQEQILYRMYKKVDET